MRYFLILWALLATVFALCGCDTHPQEVLVTDVENKPIEGAVVHIWAFTLSTSNSASQASDLEARYHSGEKLPGWTIITDASGKAVMEGADKYKIGLQPYDRPYAMGKNHGMPTDRAQTYRVGRTQTTVYPDGTTTTKEIDDPANTNDGKSFTIYSNERPTLAVTVEASGYETRTVVLTGPTPSGSIKLTRKPVEQQQPNLKLD